MKITIKADLSLEVFLPNQEKTTEVPFFSGEVFNVEVLNIQTIAPEETYVTVKTSGGTIIPDLLMTQNDFIDFEE